MRKQIKFYGKRWSVGSSAGTYAIQICMLAVQWGHNEYMSCQVCTWKLDTSRHCFINRIWVERKWLVLPHRFQCNFCPNYSLGLSNVSIGLLFCNREIPNAYIEFSQNNEITELCLANANKYFFFS
jgi:hypothetical protein